MSDREIPRITSVDDHLAVLDDETVHEVARGSAIKMLRLDLAS